MSLSNAVLILSAQNIGRTLSFGDTGLRVVKLASIRKRFLAEVIDFLILAFVKVFVIQLIYGDEYLERFSFVVIIDSDTSLTDVEWMLLQAFLFRFVIIAYEAFMLSGTLPFSNGSSLGKRIVGIKVIYAEDVAVHDPVDMTIRLNEVKPLGTWRSCVRSLLKNTSISFLFPTILSFLIFSHNRLVYDLVCVFPLNSPLLEEYMEDNVTTQNVLYLMKKPAKPSKRAKLTIKETPKSLQDNSSTVDSSSDSSSLSSTIQPVNMTAIIDSSTENCFLFPIWENKGLLCWLDTALALLVFNQTLSEEMKMQSDVDCIFSLIYLEYGKILKSFRYHNDYRKIEESLIELRKMALNFLQPKLLSNFGDEDSPLFSLPLLIKTHKEVYPKIEFDYECIFRCEKCAFVKKDGFRKAIMTLPKVEEELRFCDNIYFMRQCYKCNSKDQKTHITVERFPTILIVHFPQGVSCKRCWLDFNFTADSGQYVVTQIVQYLNRKRHFILWSYSYQENLWLEADDLKDHTTSYKHKQPKCRPGEVHIVVWEKVDLLRKFQDLNAGQSEIIPNERKTVTVSGDKEKEIIQTNLVSEFRCPVPVPNVQCNAINSFPEMKSGSPTAEIPKFKPYISRKRQLPEITDIDKDEVCAKYDIVNRTAYSSENADIKSFQEIQVNDETKEHSTGQTDIDGLYDADIEYEFLFADSTSKKLEGQPPEAGTPITSISDNTVTKTDEFFNLEDLLH